MVEEDKDKPDNWSLPRIIEKWSVTPKWTHRVLQSRTLVHEPVSVL